MRTSRAVSRRRTRSEGGHWLSFSDLMSTLLLIFILIMFYIMYQYFDMYEINMAEIARQQYDLDQANASLTAQQEKLSEAESKMLAQQIRLNAAQQDLDDAESVLAAQQADLETAQALLSDKEAEIASQQTQLDALSTQLTDKQAQLDALSATLDDKQVQINQQQARLDAQEETLNTQADTLNAQALTLEQQQQVLEDQQAQIEQLIGLKPRIIFSLSTALKNAHINAEVDPATGSIALESDVLFSTGKFQLTEQGQRFIDQFLPVYLNVLFSDEYRDNVSEIIIEGHTDSVGSYLSNLELSQQRALHVAAYVLSDDYTGITPQQKAMLRKVVTANGRSFSELVYDANGREDQDASRRVVFKFRLTDEQMIQQMQSILESADADAAAALRVSDGN